MDGYIDFPVDVRIEEKESTDDLTGYYLMLAKENVAPAGILLTELSQYVEVRVVSAIIGEVRLWSLQDIPSKWLECNGQTVLRTSLYGSLLTSVGSPFGVGDGSTTVNIPDLKSRSPMGVEVSQSRLLGEKEGSFNRAVPLKNHTHNVVAWEDVNLRWGTGAIELRPKSYSPQQFVPTSIAGDGAAPQIDVQHPVLMLKFIVYVGE